MTNLRLEAAVAIQERKKRLEEKKAAKKEHRRKNSPSEKQRREEHGRKRDDSMRLFQARMDAENSDAREPPLYEVVLEHIDIADPKFAPLRGRLIVSVKRAITDAEYRPAGQPRSCVEGPVGWWSGQLSKGWRAIRSRRVFYSGASIAGEQPHRHSHRRRGLEKLTSRYRDRLS
jgi:hypothetical protein